MKRMWAAVVATGFVALSGCSNDNGEPAGIPSPTTTPTLAEPVELDYYASVITDNGSDLALVGDWMSQKLRVVDAKGDEKWSIDSNGNEDDGGGTEAYSAGENVIVHDYSGATTAYSWTDGQKAWSFDLPSTAGSCRPVQSFGSQSTSGNSRLGEGDLILIENIWMDAEENCEPSADGNTVLYALDPKTGKEAWPALSLGEGGQTFGGRLIELAPDRKSGVMSWMDGDESMVTRVELDDGSHTSIPITEAREIDDTGADYFTVYPTDDPASLTYVYGSMDGDDPMSSTVTRAAKLSIPAVVKPSDSATLATTEQSARVSMEDTFDAVCSTALSFTADGKAACLQTQLFASAVKYQGSDGASTDGIPTLRKPRSPGSAVLAVHSGSPSTTEIRRSSSFPQQIAGSPHWMLRLANQCGRPAGPNCVKKAKREAGVGRAYFPTSGWSSSPITRRRRSSMRRPASLSATIGRGLRRTDFERAIRDRDGRGHEHDVGCHRQITALGGWPHRRPIRLSDE
ncbi:hypothetical protein [Brevibacterium sp. JSBI002]|uniref:hypothetical protein n=1 Tax=Brevibacterium sp. JSBI002 TaxID=2886045 RepID=UPI00222ED1CD|nr:hypothetical protein [Brevibacterium sp. JSBI002]UZD61880.1 hypothetical protein LJ362_14600 [Brevibacterium sp. JSBI002]